MAVLMCVGDTIDYCFMSEALQNCDGLQWVKKGTTLPPRCPTRTFNEARSNITCGRRAAGCTSLDGWFHGAPQVEIKKDVVGLGGYGRTLTVLFTEGAMCHEEDDEESGD